MVILVISALVCTQIHVIIHPSYKEEKIHKNIIIIHKKIYSNNHFTVPGLAEMKIGLGHKIGSRKIGGSTV